MSEGLTVSLGASDGAIGLVGVIVGRGVGVGVGGGDILSDLGT